MFDLLGPSEATGSSDAQLAVGCFSCRFPAHGSIFWGSSLTGFRVDISGKISKNVSRRTWALIPRKPTTGFKIEILLTGGWFTCVVPTRFVWWSSPKSIKESHDIYIQLYLNTLYVLSIWCILYIYIIYNLYTYIYIYTYTYIHIYIYTYLHIYIYIYIHIYIYRDCWLVSPNNPRSYSDHIYPFI